jgi:two-component system response regulator MtrA
VLRVGHLTINLARREIQAGGRPVHCTPAEFEILAAMAARPGSVFTRQQLLERSSPMDRHATERAVDVHVRNLRKKIEADPSRPIHLVTVFGVGYKISDGRSGTGRGPDHEA